MNHLVFGFAEASPLHTEYDLPLSIRKVDEVHADQQFINFA